MKAINFYFLEFALNSLLRQKVKNSFVIIVFTLLIVLVSSIFQVSNGLRSEALNNVDNLPEIIIQKQKAGKTIFIEHNMTNELLQINGVSYASSRIWGYYYFAHKNKTCQGLARISIFYLLLLEMQKDVLFLNVLSCFIL